MWTTSCSAASSTATTRPCSSRLRSLPWTGRWDGPLLVPGWAAENDVGTLVVAETFGYLPPRSGPAWSSARFGARFAGRAFDALGGVAAALILMGVLSPLALPLVDLANFGGYVLWSAWLLIFAAVLVRRGTPQPSRA